MLHTQLLQNTLHFSRGEHVLILNSANDPIVQTASKLRATLTLAEDNLASVQLANKLTGKPLHHLAFHDYTLHSPPDDKDTAIMNILYQPSNAWMFYGVELAYYALRPGGNLYIVGARDRGILSVGKRMRERFGNLETLETSKGQRVITSQKKATTVQTLDLQPLQMFADSKLDPGTALLLEMLEVNAHDQALDLGCGAGFIGLHIARHAPQGRVTLLDSSLAAVAVTTQAAEQSGLHNLRILPSNGVQAVAGEHFDLVATNPPFHHGGIQTTEIAEHFIKEAAQVLQPTGRFYLVANRFLKYEPALQASFQEVKEVGGNTKYKVIRAREAKSGG
jgi:16S rRNA (guanine1207-N2)-methyltransferase